MKEVIIMYGIKYIHNNKLISRLFKSKQEFRDWYVSLYLTNIKIVIREQGYI